MCAAVGDSSFGCQVWSRFPGKFAETFVPLRDTGVPNDGSAVASPTVTLDFLEDEGDTMLGGAGVSREWTALNNLLESEKYLGDGCETIEPASDRTVVLSSSGSSDDVSMDSECVAQRCVPASRVPRMCANATQDSLLGGGPGAMPKWKPLPEEGLVDLDPVEGRRRGAEIMAILRPVHAKIRPLMDDRAKHANREHVEACDSNNTSSAPFLACYDEDEVIAWSLPAPLDQSYVSQDLRLATSQSWPRKFWSGCDPWLDTVCAAIHEAARFAYGSYFVGLQNSVGRRVAVCLRDGSKQWDACAVLDSLSRALCPLLGDQVVAIDSNVTSLRAFLTLELSCEGENDRNNYCWEFVKYGTCSRGDRCRWKHAAQATRLVDIEIVF